MEKYHPKSIEQKWQTYWAAEKCFEAHTHKDKKPCYVLEMFPYPSGRLHMGHVRNYAIGDAYARFKWALGFNVLHPIGWDAFGLPAENAAIQYHVQPRAWTKDNTKAMGDQFRLLGNAYDWSREFATCDVDYYAQQQRLFIDFLKAGLVYQKESWVNWDPVEQTVLANEQVIDGKGWRSGEPVEKRQLSQWFFKITAFADDLRENLKNLNGWPEKVKIMQENWIGKSTGAEVIFDLIDRSGDLRVFTTRPETLFGGTFCAISPDHPLAQELAHQDETIAHAVKHYQSLGTSEKALETAEKEGIFTGLYVKNPFDEARKLPVYIANYVLMDYGTGVVFGCPAHDQRDYVFAKKYGIEIHPVISLPDGSLPDLSEEAYIDNQDGTIIQSGFLDGLSPQQGIQTAINALEKHAKGKRVTTYRLRDWGVSRQRYWGCPIPIVYCDDCGAVPETRLPVTLPDDVSFDNPGNPLVHHPTWKHTTCPTCGKKATRETDTLDTFVDSSWYFLRFCNPHATDPIDKEAANYWMPVEQYVGGIEHAVLHLLYARFFTHALHKLGYISFKEPFVNLLTQGMVCHETYKSSQNKWLFPEEVSFDKGKAIKSDDGTTVKVGPSEKMSKSKCNVVDPTHIIQEYGADTARLFVLSDSPPEKDFDWTEAGLNGAWRFVQRLWTIVHESVANAAFHAQAKPQTLGQQDLAIEKLCHKTIKHVTEDYQKFHFNKAIARVRELVNAFQKATGLSGWTIQFTLKTVLQLLNPFVPHITEELWAQLGHTQPLTSTPWPKENPVLAQDDLITLGVQVNGKLRATFEVNATDTEAQIKEMALDHPLVQKAIQEKTVRRVIYVPGRIINVVI